MKNIAFLIPTLDNGGAERVASNLSLSLGEKYNLYIIVHDAGKVSYPYKGTVVGLNSPIGSKNPLVVLSNQILRVYRIRKIKKKLKISTTISFFEPCNIYNLLSRCKDRVILSVHNFKSKEAAKSRGVAEKLYRILIRLLYNKAGKIVAVSEMIKQDLCEHFGIREEKIRVIYNPYDVKAIQQFAAEQPGSGYETYFGGPVVIHVGRLAEQKGQWHLIRAFQRVREKAPGTKLIILGKGELEGKLREMIRCLGLEEDISLPGFQKNPYSFIKRSAVFAFPSLYEGFGIALAEALVCGVPVVSADCRAGPREILAPDSCLRHEAPEAEYAAYGVLVPVCDGVLYEPFAPLTREEEILAEAIIRLLQDKKLRERYKKAGAARAWDFDHKTILPEWIKLIEEEGEDK